MLSRSRSVSSPRWSPSGARLAWVEALRRPGRRGGRAVRRQRAADRRDRRVRGRRRATPGSTTTLSSSRAPTAGWWSCSRDGGVERVLTARRPGASRPRCRRAARLRARSSATTRATSRRFRSTVRVGPSGSRTPTTPGTRRGRPTAARSCGRSGTCRTCRGTRRAIMRRDGAGDRRTTVVADGRCVQPAAVLARRRAPRVDPRRRARRRRRAAARRGSRSRSARNRRGRPGQRSFAWSPDGAELAWCRNESGFGRLVIGAPGRKSARELSRGWHRDLDVGRRAASSCVRSGAVTPGAGRRARRERFGSPRDRARARSAASKRTGLVEPRPVMWKSGARPCTACCGAPPTRSGPAPARRAGARRSDRAGARRLESARAVARAAGLRGAAAELPRFVGLRRSRTATRSTGGGASSTSPTSSPGSSTR